MNQRLRAVSYDATGVSASMTIAFLRSLAVASVGLAPTPIHFLIAGAFKLVSLLRGLYHPSLCIQNRTSE